MSTTQLESLPYSVWSGCGNAYAFLDLRGVEGSRVAAIEERAADLAGDIRATAGPGTDGLVLVTDDHAADARVSIWNADGSRGAVCGNALRCLARALAEERGERSTDLIFAGDTRSHLARVARDATGRWHASVSLGRASFDAAEIPIDANHDAVVGRVGDGPWKVAIAGGGKLGEGLALSVGNPHLVLALDGDPDAVDVASIGERLESHAAFPDRVNVSFAHAVDRQTLDQRTYERGSGETLACGSGACAAVVALTSLGALERDAEIDVRMRGGTLGVRWSYGGDLWLSGATERTGGGELAVSIDVPEPLDA